MGGIREDLGIIYLSDLMVQNFESLKTFSFFDEDDNGKQKDVIYHRVGMIDGSFIWLNSFMERVKEIDFKDLETKNKKKTKKEK